MSRKRLSTLERVLILLTICLIAMLANLQLSVYNLNKSNIELKESEVLARLANRRMLRSRTGFQLPGFEPILVERITRTAEAFGTPWYFPAAVAKVEHGGDTLEFGMNDIPEDIKRNSPVMEWQAQYFCRLINKEAWRVIMSDPLLMSRVLLPFGSMYNHANHDEWMTMVTTKLNQFRQINDPIKIADSNRLEQDSVDLQDVKSILRTKHNEHKKKHAHNPGGKK